MNRKQSLLTLGLCAVVGLVLLTACSKKPSEESARCHCGADRGGSAGDESVVVLRNGTRGFAGAAVVPELCDRRGDGGSGGTVVEKIAGD